MNLSESEIVQIAADMNREFWDDIFNHALHEKMILKYGCRENAISYTFSVFLSLTRKEIENYNAGLN